MVAFVLRRPPVLPLEANGLGVRGERAGRGGEPARACNPTVTTNPGFQGAISGVDANDMVNLSSRQGGPLGMPMMVNTEGGTVSVKGGSHVSITNAASSGAATLVKLQNGTGFTMGPGSSVTILTS